jgi:hypothetical protein
MMCHDKTVIIQMKDRSDSEDDSHQESYVFDLLETNVLDLTDEERSDEQKKIANSH